MFVAIYHCVGAQSLDKQLNPPCQHKSYISSDQFTLKLIDFAE